MGGDSPKGTEEVKSLCLRRSYTDRSKPLCPALGWRDLGFTQKHPVLWKPGWDVQLKMMKFLTIYMKSSWIFQTPAPNPHPGIPGNWHHPDLSPLQEMGGLFPEEDKTEVSAQRSGIRYEAENKGLAGGLYTELWGPWTLPPSQEQATRNTCVLARNRKIIL